jgi:phage shock protein A
MLHIAVQVRELVSSNVTSLVDSASNPEKMLRLLQRRIEDTIIAMQGDLTKARRVHARLLAEVPQLARTEADWTDKARMAMDKKREDLARAALLARENTRKDLASRQAESEQAAVAIAEMASAIDELSAKRQETLDQLAAVRASAPESGKAALSGKTARSSRTEQRMDRISALEQRIDFVTAESPPSSDAAVAAEFDRMALDARLNEELAAMKTATRSAGKPKGKGKA